MKTLLTVLTCICWVLNISCQEQVLNIGNTLHEGYRFVDNSYTAVGKNSFCLFINNNKDITARMYSKDLNLIGEFLADTFPNKYLNILGFTIKDHQLRYFLQKRNKNKFGSIVFDFDSLKTVENEFDFKLEKEVYIESFGREDKFYLITVDKNSNLLNLYIFNHDGSYIKTPYNFSNKTLKDSKGNNQTLYDILTQSLIFMKFIEASYIKDDAKQSLDVSNNTNKLYPTENGFILTADKSDLATYLFLYNSDDNTLTFDMLIKNKLVGEYKPGEIRTNSFFLDNKLFQIVVSKDEMIANVSNITSKQELKRWTLSSKDEKIGFSNSAIIIEGGAYNRTRIREIEKPSKFLRKVNNKNVGILSKKIGENYQVIFGASVTSQGYVGPAMFTISTGAAGQVAPSYTWFGHHYNYLNYKYTKSTRIEGLYNSSFEQLDDSIPEPVFEKISSFEDTLKYKKATTTFKFNNNYYYGYYHIKNKEYLIYQFPVSE
ncbi:MAG TPA: hypothetical protein EYN07_08035 [Flavobacteriaceae bacterium]|nr:hypothetical protein [Flavobacteriaceae bacterium]HIB47309.1 hypothetical protein [Flavobacteriaceae bacterium]HIN99172.1 hypothetical protein [Flavobacteriaceae bacterium]|tara:strand:- start:657 stop:2120 length:1464 start_codon:yes stop_codon:yes gene_type:complete